MTRDHEAAAEDLAAVVRCITLLVDGDRFAGEQRFIHGEVVRLENAAVGRDAVTLGDAEQISPNHVAAWNPHALAVTHDQRARTAEVAQRLQGALGAVFLNHRDEDGEAGEAEQDQGLHPIAQGQVDQAGQQQEGEHGLPQDFRKGLPPTTSRCAARLVGTVPKQALARLGLRQSLGELYHRAAWVRTASAVEHRPPKADCTA